MSNVPAIIQVENLHKPYRGRVAVDNVSFSVEEGEISGLVGPNGAGKTTVECVEALRAERDVPRDAGFELDPGMAHPGREGRQRTAGATIPAAATRYFLPCSTFRPMSLHSAVRYVLPRRRTETGSEVIPLGHLDYPRRRWEALTRVTREHGNG